MLYFPLKFIHLPLCEELWWYIYIKRIFKPAHHDHNQGTLQQHFHRYVQNNHNSLCHAISCLKCRNIVRNTQQLNPQGSLYTSASEYLNNSKVKKYLNTGQVDKDHTWQHSWYVLSDVHATSLNNSIGPIARNCPKWPSGNHICGPKLPAKLIFWQFG